MKHSSLFLALLSAVLTAALFAGCKPTEKAVYVDDAQVRFQGSIYYSQAGCAGCHGAQFDGQGPDNGELKARGIVTPGFQGVELPPARTPNDFFKVITMGTERLPSHAYQSYTDRGRWAMAYFLYSLTKAPVGAKAAEREAALAAARSEAMEAYSRSRRWEMGYKPIGERAPAPALKDLMVAAPAVEQRSAGAVDSARRDRFANAASDPAAGVYARNCAGCHGEYGEGRSAAQRFGLYPCTNEGRYCGAYLSTGDFRSAAAMASVDRFREAHNAEATLNLRGFDSWTDEEWAELYAYVQTVSGL